MTPPIYLLNYFLFSHAPANSSGRILYTIFSDIFDGEKWLIASRSFRQ